MSADWTNDQRKAWAALWAQGFMQEGLRELERRCRVTPIIVKEDSGLLAKGYDALVIAAAEHHRRAGQIEVLNMISDMGKIVETSKTLPQPFTAEARRENKPE